ncbi:hypothetical protein [Halonotius roseus]|uniref:Uncharacterized protein n=1 Tax=Halonotius roseus TaxID=2511997 RepID=A0A544QQY1_9EURY|nr:hypothetical protein [Halonotius roseus]TQQ81846.1 hypothetical protein EWF95_02610 [Halonotius roseus]
MGCGLADGIAVEFLTSGLSFQPYEVKTRSGHRKFSYTKITVSREVGEEISENAGEFEPVLVTFDGVVQDRYMFHPEAVKLHNENATLTLYDGEKILEKGTVNKHFQHTTLEEVIAFIIGRRQDPNGVIVGVKPPDSGIEDSRVANDNTLGRSGIVGQIFNVLTASLGVRLADTSININDATPYEAMKKVADSFSLTTWVDADGYFNYGVRGTNPNAIVVGADDDQARLKEYNVTVGSGKVTEIILQGQYAYTSYDFDGIYQSRKTTDMFSYGKATLSGAEGGRSLKPQQTVSASKPKDVEDAAQRELLKHYMNRKNGNLVLNGGASTAKAQLTKLAVGDVITASGEIEEHCTRSVDTGTFAVQSVQHTLDSRRGWLVDVGVAALPGNGIETESWLYDPATDQQWESVDDVEPISL